MPLPFRDYHLLRLLEEYGQKSLPLDKFLRDYFYKNKALGSKDRKFIAETAYGIIRWLGLIDYFCDQDSSTWEERYKIYQTLDPHLYLKDPTIPIHVRYSFPKELFSLLRKSYGEKKSCQFCLSSNVVAPTTIRVNSLKIERAKLLKKWEGLFDISPCEFSKNGITFQKRVNFFGLEEFKKGFFEVQDEGSQLIADMVTAFPGDHVMDYCAGAGGKALAFAPRLKQKGQIYLHDVREYALKEAKVRLRRAGIQNAQIISPEASHLKKLKKGMDWILVDAPCSGSGTLRRNPDLKWKFSLETLKRLTSLQRSIFEKALSFLKPDGFIVYATCSVFPEENEQQVDHFLKTYPLEIVGNPFQSFPEEGKMDGFFAITFRKINSS